jgi:hypothetical protein
VLIIVDEDDAWHRQLVKRIDFHCSRIQTKITTQLQDLSNTDASVTLAPISGERSVCIDWFVHQCTCANDGERAAHADHLAMCLNAVRNFIECEAVVEMRL